ncbi:MAG: putative LPS assembly protein LptD [Acidobacteriota bacterium]
MFSKTLSAALCGLLLVALVSESVFALTRQPQQESKTKKKDRADSEQSIPDAKDSKPKSADTVVIESDSQTKNGDILSAAGYVNCRLEDMRLQADHVTYNEVTGDMVAEGNVIFDQGENQRVTARRAEINWNSRRGTFWETTGFTNRTQTGDYIYFVAARVEKTGPDTYELFDASVTACEDAVPKWTFTVKRAELKREDRLTLHNATFRVKGFPAFFLPYAWIPATSNERKSGFLIPTTGTSNQKGRTFKTAYYQTLGQSADITFRNDIYTSRGLGFGAEFRAQTDERSYMRLGMFTVKDRLFGEEGEDQGGTAFVADAVQYLPKGWLAVGNVSFVTSLRFRQVFSDDISQVIDPRRESTFYVNNNTRDFSFNFLTANERTTLFRPDAGQPTELPPRTGKNFDIKIRQLPQIDMTLYPRRLIDRLPIYFSLDASLGALKREETVDDNIVLVTPAAVQRLDLQAKVTVPLATFAGIAVTPTVTARETFYSNSRDPLVPSFDPQRFALLSSDPRLNPTRAEFDPRVQLFDRNQLNPITTGNLSRRFFELAVDIRPPALERVFQREDGSQRFKHLIEPYITYRLIRGVGDEFNRIIRFDERDAVANTNEFEYALVNRFFVTRRASEIGRRRRRRRERASDETETVKPDREKKEKKEKKEEVEAKSQTPEQMEAKKQKIETGEQAELSRQKEQKQGDKFDQGDEEEDTSPVQAYEFLTIKIAQKYFFDRTFGGALAEGRRNQFYPINTLSGFTFGGKARSFSPAHVEVRYRPLSLTFADIRMDIGSEDKAVRNVTVGGGVGTEKFTVSASYNLSRRISLSPNAFEPGTFAGNQLTTTFQYGDETRGFYGGARVGYDFTDRFVGERVVSGRLRNTRSYIGYQWDCCGLQFNYNTFKAGLRNESAFSFTFTLAGLGSFGTDQFSQLGGGRGGRRRGRRSRRDPYDNY